MAGKILFLKQNSKGVYLLPNMLTTIALCFGFVSILLSLQADIVNAAKCVFFALIADGLDGRVARLTGTQSEFGKQYDSLADLVAFGVAPAILILVAAVGRLGHIGWGLSFVYVALTAIRLAKFNVKETSVGDFQGLPCPSAALLLANSILMFEPFLQYNLSAWVFGFVAVLLGLLMVSSIAYPSFKELSLNHRYSKFWVLIMVAFCAAVVVNPTLFLWLLFLAFVLYGPLRYLYYNFNKLKK